MDPAAPGPGHTHQSKRSHSTAKAVYEIYNDVADTELTRLYTTVEHDFGDYYRRINADDESSFKAGLAPSAGKLDQKSISTDWACFLQWPITARAIKTVWECASIWRSSGSSCTTTSA